MYVLGINCCLHDAAAALIENGKIVACAEEERFNRIKHTGEIPVNAIEYCLVEAGISIKQVDYVAFYWKPWLGLPYRAFHLLKYFPRSMAFFRKREVTAGDATLLRDFFSVHKKLRGHYVKDSDLPGFRFEYVDHHLAHAASSFFVSPFEESAILSLDGSGEYQTTLLAKGERNRIKPLGEIKYPHSLGILYTSTTQYLGFTPNNDEYKVMGLASYGEPSYYDEFRNEVVRWNSESFGFRLNLDYFCNHLGYDRWYSKAFVEKFGPPFPQGYRNEKDERFANIAASVQLVLEEAVLEMVRHLHSITNSKNLCIAGGVGLNSVMNGRILRESPFENVFIQPAANDAGTSLGAALYVYHELLRNERRSVMKHAYLGPSYSDFQIKEQLDKFSLQSELCKDVAKKAADLIAEGKIICWFQGRMEFGPRALGNRSILADPRRAEMKDIVNTRIKHREKFRPFAPAIMEDAYEEYFNLSQPSPYMLFVCAAKPGKGQAIPAVIHVDGTGRVQTVNEMANPLFYSLIRHFEKLTGVPVVLNTSFNDQGEPIVCSPSDAIKCFRNIDADYLIIGNYMVKQAQR